MPGRSLMCCSDPQHSQQQLPLAATGTAAVPRPTCREQATAAGFPKIGTGIAADTRRGGVRMQRGVPGGAAGRPRTGATTGTSVSVATGNAADRQLSGIGGADWVIIQPAQCCCVRRHVNSDAICRCLKIAAPLALAHDRKSQELRLHIT